MTPEIALCFVSRENWPEYCRISADIPDDSDYDTFLKGAQEFCDGVAADGGRAIKIHVDPGELLAWTQTEGVDVNSNSRARYAALQLSKKQRGG
ncbi:MAG: hypothetical protein GXY83_23995 [Rhodopirellula sp.]|nr:hypothetical protein [Rhodopirellula sp.]